MTWTYTDPSASPRDETRFLVGDTDVDHQQLQDEEVDYALGRFSQPTLAAALLLRTLATHYSRKVSMSVGDVSRSLSDLSKQYSDRAKELDPFGVTIGPSRLALPVFGGISREERRKIHHDTDAIQPNFTIGLNDNPRAMDPSLHWQYDEDYPFYGP